MAKQHPVKLTEEQILALKSAARKGTYKPKIILHIKALLLMDQGIHAEHRFSVQETASTLGISDGTLTTLRRVFWEQGVDGILNPRKRPRKKRKVKFDGEFEMHVMELACEKPPDGHKIWTLRLLADRLVELEIVDTVSRMTVQRALKKTNCSLKGKNAGRLLPNIQRNS